jgi:SAM-dependent methyltransferase
MNNQNELVYRKLQASLYDSNYKLKDYNLESNFILNIIINNCKGDIGTLNLLDVGCGTGTHVSLLSQYFAKLVGIDSSPDMISLARQKYKKLKNTDFLYTSVDDLKTKFPPNFFDVVILMYSVSGYLGPISNLVSKIKILSSIMTDNAILIFDYWDIALLNYEYEISREKLLYFGESEYRKTSIGKIDHGSAFVDSYISWEEIGTETKWSETHRVYCYKNTELILQLEKLNFKVILDAEDGKIDTPVIDRKSRWLIAIKTEPKESLT